MTRAGKPGNIGASIRDRLLNKARAEKLDFNLLLTRYALERMLYRLCISEQRDQFLLKGALLFDLWFDVPHRPTHDADLWILAKHADFDGSLLTQAVAPPSSVGAPCFPSAHPSD